MRDFPDALGRDEGEQGSAERLVDFDGVDGDRLRDLASAAGTQYQPQVTALQSSVSALSTQVKALGSSPSAAGLAAIVPAAQKVATDFKGLTDAIGSACD